MAVWTIYVIKNMVNGKKYVGITTKDLQERLDEHFVAAYSGRRGKNGRIYALHAAIKKYSQKNFEIEKVEYCVELLEAQGRETYWIKKWDTYASGTVRRGYNMSYGGEEPDFDPYYW